jgi:Spy/CpxP family protein refolding chaperone
MFGFVLGTLCLIGFIAVWRRRHGWYRGGFHHAYGPGCGHGRGYGHGGRLGWRQRFGLYRVFEELDTSPGQEKAIRGALGELRAVFAALRPQLVETRESLAAALTSEPFDTAALERRLQDRLDEVSNVGPALAAAVAKIHDALDADQRKRLARLVGALPYGPMI